MHERNLVIVHTPGRQDISDFIEVRRLITARAPDIEVFIVDNVQPDIEALRRIPRRATVFFSPYRLMGFRPLNGRVYAGFDFGKLEQVRRLAATGLPVPKTSLLVPGMSADPDYWGSRLLLKPTFGYRGRGIKLVRTSDARYERFCTLSDPPVLVQQFIDTGAYPTSYRTLTIFGRVLYCIKMTSGIRRADAAEPSARKLA